MIRNPVLALLVALGLAAALGLAFLSHAPNRLVSGAPIALATLLDGPRALLLLPALWLAAAPFLPDRRSAAVATVVAGVLTAGGLLLLAGDAAARLADPEVPARRTSFGAAFWVLEAVALLAAAEGLRRAEAPPLLRVATWAGLAGLVAVVVASGRLDDLSILKEFAGRRDVVGEAVLRHLGLVAAALVPALVIGWPLGVAAARRPSVRGPVFGLLSVIQTVPSIALFALMMAPLSALALAVPALRSLGVSGVGAAPAVIALTLYSMLPLVRATAVGLAAVPAAALEAANGMGFSARQRFWQVEVPLALPVWLAGLRVTLVQALGLAVVAALIGAGGLGAIVFQGLGAGALDLVLLGVVPLVSLTLAVDGLFRLAVALLPARTPT